jgi:hypothetical protein
LYLRVAGGVTVTVPVVDDLKADDVDLGNDE